MIGSMKPIIKAYFKLKYNYSNPKNVERIEKITKETTDFFKSKGYSISDTQIACRCLSTAMQTFFTKRKEGN